MLNIWQISWRNITQNKKRFLFTLLAIILGTSFVTAMLVADRTTNDVFDYYEEMYVGNADYWILSDEHTYSDEVITPIQKNPSVINILKAYDKQAFFELEQNRPLNQRSVRITGVDDQNSELLKLPLIKGELDNQGVILPENVAELLNKDVGDYIGFSGLGEMKISAIVEYTQLLQSPNDWESAESSGFRVMVPLDQLREWTGEENALSYVRFQTIGDEEGLFQSLQQTYQGTNEFVQPVVADDLQSNDIGGLYTLFYITAGLAILISGFIVFNMINTSVIERKKEFAVMKSLGYLQASISKLILIEIFVLSAIGTVIGIPMGIWIGDLFIEILLDVFEFDMVYTLNWQIPSVIAVITGILFPIIFSLFPIYNAGRTSILLTLKTANQQRSSKGQKRIRFSIGFILLMGIFVNHEISFVAVFISIILLFPLLLTVLNYIFQPILKYFFKYSGVMATKYLTQHLNRNANTSSILAGSIAVILMLSAAVESAPDSYERDIRNTYGGEVKVSSEEPWTLEDKENILTYEGINSATLLTEATPITWKTTENEDRQFSVIGVEEGETQLFETSNEEKVYKELTSKPSIVLGSRAFEEWGGDLGEHIEINTPNGTQNFKVVDNVSTSQHSGYVGFMDESYLNEEFGWGNNFDILLDSNNQNHDQIRNQLWQEYEGNLQEVQTVEEEINSTTSAISGMNELILVLLIMIISLASIGTANTLLMNTMERISEIGTMRALGFTKSQVKKMILAEGLLIGLSGVIGGIIGGTLLIYLASRLEIMNDFIQFQLPLNSVIVAIISGIFLSFCAALISSRSATNKDVKESLKEG